MADRQKSIDFLKDIGKFYQPEHPEEKKGIGHEVEHVKGVMRRMMQISKLMQGQPETYGEQHLAETKELTPRYTDNNGIPLHVEEKVKRSRGK